MLQSERVLVLQQNQKKPIQPLDLQGMEDFMQRHLVNLVQTEQEVWEID